jgi:mono/diheme cytochrome c family protein
LAPGPRSTRKDDRDVRCFWQLMAVLISLTVADTAHAEGDRVRGRELAIAKCFQCHVIGDYNPYGGVSNSPSFYIFSERLEVYRERLQTFDQRRPHLSRDLRLPPKDLQDVIAYVESLERP